MAQPGSKQVHKSKRHNNPMAYKSGKPRLRTLNTRQLMELAEKTQTKKEKAKIFKVAYQQQKRKLDKLEKEHEVLQKYSKEELFKLHMEHKKWSKVIEVLTK